MAGLESDLAGEAGLEVCFYVIIVYTELKKSQDLILYLLYDCSCPSVDAMVNKQPKT